MFLQRKAIYNLLQINLPRIESGELKVAELQPWQTENYRKKSTDMLIEDLHDLGISFGDLDHDGWLDPGFFARIKRVIEGLFD